MTLRTGAPHDHAGYFHESAFYGSDEEFLAVVEPFLRGGVEAGEPTLVTCAASNAALLRNALADIERDITFIAGEPRYVTPASTIRTYLRTFADLVAAGASQIRVVGDVPHPGVGAPWGSWARYEAAVTHLYDSFPVWGLCPYDTRSAPDHVLDDVARLHPHIATADGHATNPRYQGSRFLADWCADVDPVELTEPDLVILDPSAGDARRGIAALVERTTLDDVGAADLVVAVSEAVSNAHLHGEPPVRLTAWCARDRVVVAVRDAGTGPADPFAGLVGPADSDVAGRGLWIAHQVCTDVGLRVDADGFTVRLVMERPADR